MIEQTATMRSSLKKLPNHPGVYFFLGRNKQILYVGKATSLKNRVQSYFRDDLIDTRGPLIADMIKRAKSVEFRKTDSVLEALLLEADLIKKFKPEYNTAQKDDKSYNCVVITDEDFPRVLVVRKKDLADGRLKDDGPLQAVYGPFPEGLKLKTAMKIIRRILPFRDKCVPAQESGLNRPCFNAQIGLCPGVCSGAISKEEYGKLIKNIRLLFEGKKRSLIQALRREMRLAAKTQEFEKAAAAKHTIFALENIQDVALISEEKRFGSFGEKLPFRVEAYDVAHTAGIETVGVMTVIEGGLPNKNEYRMFKVKSAEKGNDVGALKEILSRRFRHEEWRLPDIIVVDGGAAQKRAAESVVLENIIEAKDVIPVVAVTKDEYHRPKRILGFSDLVQKNEGPIIMANAEAHRFAIKFHRKRRTAGFLDTNS